MERKKDKILFWLESYYIHFGIAKSITEKHPCEPYALISCTPNQKNFYDNQELINFQKTWYVRDFIDLKNKSPDFEKLKRFERKFSIPLTKIAYADRLFYKFNDFHKFNDNEIFSLIQQELEFYDKILDKVSPDFVVMRAPEFHDIDLFCEVCKAKNIKVLLLSPVRMGDRYRIASEPDSPIQFDTSKDLLEIKNFEALKVHVDSFSKAHKKFIKNALPKNVQKLQAVKSLFSAFNSSNINSFRDVGKTPISTFSRGLTLLFHRSTRKSFLDKNTITSFSKNQPYAYFPLHMEPERSILKKSQFYVDQISIIKNIAQSLPVEMVLIVKEHPSMQFVGWRDLKFYKEILELPKVILLHPSVSSSTIIQNASFIATIAGTTALEAAFYKKPSIVFSDIDCSLLSSIYKINNLEELPNFVEKCLVTKVDLKELNYFVNTVIENSFTCNISELSILSSNLFGVGGLINSNPISELKMKDFLNNYKSSFDLLADEHIKKISTHKKAGINFQ